ncbi:MAG: hydroxymethylbilane synthase, partial [Sphingomonadales bacterium]
VKAHARAHRQRRARPDAEIILFRGNVDTRLAKLSAGEAEATLLASAGLDRLGRVGIGHPIPIEEMLPAPAQGAVGIETLIANNSVQALLGAIDDAQTHACVDAERALLAALGADCRSPVAALAVRSGVGLHLRAEILTEDGAECRSGEAMLLQKGDAEALARRLLDGASPRLRALFTGA